MNCPICGAHIEPEHLLLVKYYNGQDWWITHHLKPTLKTSRTRFMFGGQAYEEFCAQADIQTVTNKTPYG